MQDSAKNTTELLNQVMLKILSNSDLRETCDSILKTLRSHLGAFGGVIYFSDKKTNMLYTQSYTNLDKIERAIIPVKMKIFDWRFPIDDEKMLVSLCAKTGEAQESSRLSKFFSPIITKELLDVIQAFLGVKKLIGLPIKVNNNIYGVLFTAFQKKELSEEDRKLLEFYANLSSLAIESHMQMKDLRTRYKSEKESVALITHELKTPIAIAHNTIDSFNFYLEKNSTDLQKHREVLQKMGEEMQCSVSRLNNICNSISQLREVETKVCDTKQKMDLELFLNQLFENYKDRSEDKGLEFTYELDIAPGSYENFGVQFEQVMNILLDNAIKYTPKGSIHVSVQGNDDALACEVSDTGLGIEDKKKAKIFSKFYRAHRSLNRKHKTEGMGLGLYLAKRIVNELGGEISVKNNPSTKTGSCFSFSLPNC